MQNTRKAANQRTVCFHFWTQYSLVLSDNKLRYQFISFLSTDHTCSSSFSVRPCLRSGPEVKVNIKPTSGPKSRRKTRKCYVLCSPGIVASYDTLNWWRTLRSLPASRRHIRGGVYTAVRPLARATYAYCTVRLNSACEITATNLVAPHCINGTRSCVPWPINMKVSATSLTRNYDSDYISAFFPHFMTLLLTVFFHPRVW